MLFTCNASARKCQLGSLEDPARLPVSAAAPADRQGSEALDLLRGCAALPLLSPCSEFGARLNAF